MKLKDTIEMMTSEDYKERFKAEYYQLENRCAGLTAMLEKWDKGELNFTPTCQRGLYTDQLNAMERYLRCLEIRADAEGIEL